MAKGGGAAMNKERAIYATKESLKVLFAFSVVALLACGMLWLMIHISPWVLVAAVIIGLIVVMWLDYYWNDE